MQQVEVFNLGELTERLLILQGRSSNEVWAEEKNALFRQLKRAAASQKLRVRHPETMLPEVFAEWAPPSSGCLVSTIADVNAWLVSEGVPYSMTPRLDSTAAQPQATTPSPPPMVAAGASGGTVTVWTPERKEAARAMMNEQRGQGVKAFAANTAAAFGVTPTRLREVLNVKPKKAPAKKPKGVWGV
ncbi:hypothetical protein [Polaromonas sp.]|uniref:hypothetical protein n=1 Tax=Polaromonas sp. TaxID=1869339 RepID=UPI003BB5A1BF